MSTLTVSLTSNTSSSPPGPFRGDRGVPLGCWGVVCETAGDSVLLALALAPAFTLAGNSKLIGVTGSEAGTEGGGLMRSEPTFEVEDEETRGLDAVALLVAGEWLRGSLGDDLSGSVESV